MMMKRKFSGRALSIPAGLGIGLLIALVVTVAGAAITSWLIYAEKIGEGSSGYAAMLILALAAGTSALSAVYLIKKQRLQICMLTGVCYYLSLLGMTALLFGGQYQGMGMSAIVILSVCALIAFLPSKNNGVIGKKKKLYR